MGCVELCYIQPNPVWIDTLGDVGNAASTDVCHDAAHARRMKDAAMHDARSVSLSDETDLREGSRSQRLRLFVCYAASFNLSLSRDPAHCATAVRARSQGLLHCSVGAAVWGCMTLSQLHNTLSRTFQQSTKRQIQKHRCTIVVIRKNLVESPPPRVGWAIPNREGRGAEESRPRDASPPPPAPPLTHRTRPLSPSFRSEGPAM